MSWWRWNARPKPADAEVNRYVKIIEAAKRRSEMVAELDAEMFAEERQHPSCMWDWISPARIKRPYAE